MMAWSKRGLLNTYQHTTGIRAGTYEAFVDLDSRHTDGATSFLSSTSGPRSLKKSKKSPQDPQDTQLPSRTGTGNLVHLLSHRGAAVLLSRQSARPAMKRRELRCH
ncbi:uncharacterized protein RBU33_029080 [Hipposideros larvatus]